MRETHTGDIYAPLVAWPTIRAATVLAAAHGWKSRQVDFTLAFCQSPQPEDQPLYMELPQYYRPQGMEGRDVVLKMNKSIYGQLTSPRLFWEHLSRGMDKLGFEPSDNDPCLFIHRELPIMVLYYCDDQIWLSPDNDLVESKVKELQRLGYDLTLEPEGDLFGFLGINFESTITPDKKKKITLSQTGLIKKIINYTEMQKATTRDTPCAQEPLGSDKNGEPFNEKWSYRAAIGMLLYLSSNTRPDIMYGVIMAAAHSNPPKKSHGQALKRIVRYLMETSDKGIEFFPDLDKGLDCWVDASFAGLYGYKDEQDIESVNSHTCFILTLLGCPVPWKSSKQDCLTLSSTASEYIAFSDAMRELLPMRRLPLDISSKLDLPIMAKTLVRSTVFEDNQACLSLVNVPKMSPRNNNLALRYHFFRSEIGEDKGIVAKRCSTTEQLGDIGTKGLGPQ